MLFFVNLPHFIQVTLKSPASYEFIEHCLIDTGHRGGKKSTFLFIPLQQSGRQHHITHTDRRGDRLGKGSYINHLSCRIRGLQRRHGLSPVPEFAVIVVLNQISVFLFCRPLQKLHPPSDRHHHPCGILMGRHDIGCIRPAPGKILYGNPAFIHRDRHRSGREGRKNTISPPVRRIFKCHTDILSQNILKKQQQVIITRSDNDLFRRGIHSSGGMEVPAYCPSEVRITPWFSQGKQFFSVTTEYLSRDFPPGAEREHTHIYGIRGKIIGIVLSCPFFGGNTCPGSFLFFLRHIRHNLVEFFHPAYIIASVRGGFDVTFRQQLPVCQLHRTARHLEIFRQGTRGGKLLLPEASPP